MSCKMVKLIAGDSEDGISIDVDLLAACSPVFEKVFISGMNPVSELKIPYMTEDGLKWVATQIKDGYLKSSPDSLKNVVGMLTLCQEYELDGLYDSIWHALHLHTETGEYFDKSWNSLTEENFVNLVRLSAPWSSRMKDSLSELLLDWATHHSLTTLERDEVQRKLLVQLSLFQIDPKLMNQLACKLRLSSDHYPALLRENAKYMDKIGHFSCKVYFNHRIAKMLLKIQIHIPAYFALNKFEKPICKLVLSRCSADEISLPRDIDTKASTEVVLSSASTFLEVEGSNETIRIMHNRSSLLRFYHRYLSSALCTVTTNVPAQVVGFQLNGPPK